MDKTIKRGDIYYADLKQSYGHYCRHNKPCTQKEEITYTLIFGAN